MLATRTDDISPFHVVQVLKQVTELESQGRDVIRLFVGEPDFGAPSAITQRGVEALRNLPQGYTSSTGILPLKQAIVDRYRRWHGLELNPDRIIITPGGSAALQVAFLATLDPEDDVLLPEPGYPCNANLLAMVNARSVPVYLKAEQQMRLSHNLLEAAMTANTTGLLVASPSNPLGTIQTLDDWHMLTEFAQTYGLHLFADEIYHGLSFGELAPTALQAKDDAWVIQSFSKFYGMTGWRLGWLVVPEHAIGAVERIAQNLYLSAPTLAQYSALAGFEPAVEQECFARRDQLQQRRDFLLAELPKLNLPVIANPDGAFYLFLDISRYSQNSVAFCADLLNHTGVAITPGIDFGGAAPNTCVRLAYTENLDRLQEAVVRLSQYLSNL